MLAQWRGPAACRAAQAPANDHIECSPLSISGKEWSWELEGKLNRVGGEDGWIATQIMRTVSSDGRVRRWQWELRKHRRPPNQGAWFVESIGSSDRLGNFDLEG